MADRPVVAAIPTEAGAVPALVQAGGSGRPVLLLHDLVVDGREMLRDLFDAIGCERAVVLPDLTDVRPRASGGPDEHVSLLIRCVEDLVAHVAAHHGGDVDVVASGVMGVLATRAIRQSSRHVRSLVVLAPPARPGGLGRLARRALAGPLALGARLATSHAPTNASLVSALASARLRLSPELDAPVWVPLRTPTVTLEEVTDPVATLAAVRAFWAGLPTRPALRLIRGGGRAASPRPRPQLRVRAVGGGRGPG